MFGILFDFCDFATCVKIYNVMEEREVVARNLRRLRLAKGFTQERLVRYLGVGRSAYANYESGDREAPLEVLEHLADLYGCELFSLYDEDEHALDSVLATAFRVDDLSDEDMRQIASFKGIVKNYLKMKEMLER